MKKHMDSVNWGSIGCGDVMEVKSGPALQRIEHSTLYAVMRRDGALAKDYANRHGVPVWYDSAETLIHDPMVNAIYIATPPDSHLAYTRLAAVAGKPIYVEKPMANSYEECLAMVDVCREYQVPLFVAYYRRSLPSYLKVKEILDGGQLGKIMQVDMHLHHLPKAGDVSGDFNWRIVPEIAGCGYFCDLASHMIDLIQFLLGDVKHAEGSAVNLGGHYQAEDTVHAHMEMENGVVVKGSWDFNAKVHQDQTIIRGENGSVSYSHFVQSPVTMNVGGAQQYFDLPHPRHIQEPLIERIVEELRGGPSSPSTGLTASRTNWVMDKILGRI